MRYITPAAAIVLALGTASCATYNSSDDPSNIGGDATFGKMYEYTFRPPPMDPRRHVVVVDCRGPYDVRTTGNLRCM